MHLSDFNIQLVNALKNPDILMAMKAVLSGQVWPTSETERVIKYNERTLSVEKLDPRATVPTQKEGSAGYDLFPLEECEVYAGGLISIPTGLAMEFEDDLVALLLDRSGMGLQGIIHRAGVIDANYRGQWIVLLYNASKATIRFSPEKACIQVVFIEKIRFKNVHVVDKLSETSRGADGFGSSDKKGAA